MCVLTEVGEDELQLTMHILSFFHALSTYSIMHFICNSNFVNWYGVVLCCVKIAAHGTIGGSLGAASLPTSGR